MGLGWDFKLHLPYYKNFQDELNNYIFKQKILNAKDYFFLNDNSYKKKNPLACRDESGSISCNHCEIIWGQKSECYFRNNMLRLKNDIEEESILFYLLLLKFKRPLKRWCQRSKIRLAKKKNGLNIVRRYNLRKCIFCKTFIPKQRFYLHIYNKHCGSDQLSKLTVENILKFDL